MDRTTLFDIMLDRTSPFGLMPDFPVMPRHVVMKPPPKNYFILSNKPQAWEQFKEASKEDNSVICVEFVTEEMSRSNLFMDLARGYCDKIPFIRVKIGRSSVRTFEKVRQDVGGVTMTPTIVVVFFGEPKTLRVKFEGVNEVLEGMNSGTIHKFIRELMSRREKLKMKKKEMDLQKRYETKEEQLQHEYEERMREISEREEKLKQKDEKRKQEKRDAFAQRRTSSFIDAMLPQSLAAGLAHDYSTKESLTPPPENYFVLSDPQVWKIFKEDSRKENLVFCMEFIDEETSSTVFVDLAREFDSLPFLRVQVGQDGEGVLKEVCKDIGDVDCTPSIVVVYFGKVNDKQKTYRVKFGGLQEIQSGLQSNHLKRMITELVSKRVTLKESEAVDMQVKDKEVQDEEEQMREQYEAKMREISHMEERLRIEEAEKKKKREEVEESQQLDRNISENKRFSASMSPSELAEWLLNEFGSDFKDDIDKLKDNKINGNVLLKLLCQKQGMKEFGFSFGFATLLPDKVNELTPAVEETDQSESFVDYERKIVTFSELLGPNDLALWLFQEVGSDYKDDIEKLKGHKINAKLFLDKEFETAMDDLDLTYGFKGLLLMTLKKIKGSDPMQMKRIESFCSSSEALESTTEPENDPLKITRNPISQTRHCKQGTVLTVRASGFGTLSYQWLKDNKSLTDDTLPNCTGSTSDSLRFTSLLPEHTGSYKCQVSNNRQKVESKHAELEVPTTMKFMDFIQTNSESQDGHVTIKETLVECFNAYLQQYGYTYADEPKKLDSIITEIHSNATVNYMDAIIDFQSQEIKDKHVECLGDPKLYTNRETEDHTEQFQRNVTYLVGSESIKSSYRGWSTSGKLSASYQGVGASANVSYEKNWTEKYTHTECTQRTEMFDEYILVPSETRLKVSVKKQFTIFNCQVRDLLVTFKKSSRSQIKCKVQYGHRNKTITETFELKDVLEFKHKAVKCDQKGFTVQMSGKCTWSETSVYLHRSAPEPLHGLDIM